MRVFNTLKEKDHEWHSLLSLDPVFPNPEHKVPSNEIILCVQRADYCDAPEEKPIIWFDYLAAECYTDANPDPLSFNRFCEELLELTGWKKWIDTDDSYERIVAWKYIEPFSVQEVEQ